MKKFVLCALCLLMVIAMQSQEFVEIPIWPDGATEDNGISAVETEREGNFYNISTASMKIFSPEKSKNTGIAIIICPGGGYGMQAARHEGTQFASWYVANGITAIVLKYRLPNKHHEIPLKDVREALRIIRKDAAQWGIDPQKIGISGFSAGGHLAATLLTHFDPSSRPDFGMLFYPVISMKASITHQGSKENLIGNQDDEALTQLYSNEEQVKNNTPPTLLLLSDDDKVVVPENSILFYRSLKANNIPAAMYIFPEGGHGWGFNQTFKYHEDMKKLILEWLENVKSEL
jgi:acetyl esterase/lipase